MRVSCFLPVLVFLCLTTACFAQQQAGSSSIRFKKQTIATGYISEGVAVTDVDKDGKPDVLAGSFWWKAPGWKKFEITTPYIHPSIDGYGNSFLNFAYDVNNDGWDDLIKIGHPGEATHWYENPQKKPGHWKERLVHPALGNESPTFVDVDGDGRQDIICNDAANKKVIWLSAPSGPNDTAWKTYVISDDSTRATHRYTHGLGFGDINGDGRKDVLIVEGWWEGPADPHQEIWTFHPADFGQGCSQMYVADVDLDGDSDVISASAHEYGIWWHEQKRNGNETTWETHEIFKEFSQSHALAFEDINGDNYPDLVTGKRFWAHNGHDPGEREPAVVYWFEFVPGKTPKWTPHLVDDNSGVGLNIAITDINKDGRKDIVTSNKKGVFVFVQTK
ncbi:MAG: VCBS repeat-containing protein [Chitinophagaceae bacterium]|nr:VCBS repeat-containing protein [Chitinophagaceae bacterium]